MAKAGNSHSRAKNLILPATSDKAKIMLGKQDIEKLESISLSESTIQRRINNMATDVRNRAIEKK